MIFMNQELKKEFMKLKNFDEYMDFRTKYLDNQEAWDWDKDMQEWFDKLYMEDGDPKYTIPGVHYEISCDFNMEIRNRNKNK